MQKHKKRTHILKKLKKTDTKTERELERKKTEDFGNELPFR